MLPLFQAVEGYRSIAKMMLEIAALNDGHKICQVVGKAQGQVPVDNLLIFEVFCGLLPLRVTENVGFPLKVDKK